MSMTCDPGIWQRLCQYMAAHPTCQVLLDQHNGVVWRFRIVEHTEAERLTQPTKRATSSPHTSRNGTKR